ncbi:MAG: hypothetical protein GF317_00220 [Candidatus Lokiarchaeota archaeon]|nr:hypothetical protein [Candidatus Lokiarchaeota archaeon]MBD3198407.1 hypothetical protein [Candidatus Lokiarchaeota archaeon]
MQEESDDLEKLAEKVENQAKLEIKNRNYHKAIELLNKAKKLNQQLGFMGQIGIIEKKIKRVKNLIEFEKDDDSESKKQRKLLEEKGTKLLNIAEFSFRDEKYKKSLKNYKEALSIYQELGFQYQCQKIKTNIEKIEEIISQNELSEGNTKKETKKEQETISKPSESPYLTKLKEKREKEELEAKKYEEIYHSRKQLKQERVQSKEENYREYERKKRKEKELMKQAEEALDNGNNCINHKEFDKAKGYYKKSIELFTMMGWGHQVNILKKELDNIDSYKENYLATKRLNQKKNEGIQEQYNQRENSLLTQRKKFMNEMKKDLRKAPFDDNKEELSMAEKIRRERYRKTHESIIKAQQEEEFKNKISEKETWQEKKRSEERERLRKISEKKKKEELLLKEAEEKMDQGRYLVDQHKYDEAKILYKKAVDLFKTLGWFNQADTLYEEIKNLERYKREYIEKQRLENIRKKKEEEKYNKRVESLMNEQRHKERQRLIELSTLSPELQQSLQKAELLLKKAEKEEDLGKIRRVLSRYNYILTLYKKIPPEKLDLRSEIAEIEKKISLLKSQD